VKKGGKMGEIMEVGSGIADVGKKEKGRWGAGEK
jgi:hypothetical protein